MTEPELTNERLTEILDRSLLGRIIRGNYDSQNGILLLMDVFPETYGPTLGRIIHDLESAGIHLDEPVVVGTQSMIFRLKNADGTKAEQSCLRIGMKDYPIPSAAVLEPLKQLNYAVGDNEEFQVNVLPFLPDRKNYTDPDAGIIEKTQDQTAQEVSDTMKPLLAGIGGFIEAQGFSIQTHSMEHTISGGAMAFVKDPHNNAYMHHTEGPLAGQRALLVRDLNFLRGDEEFLNYRGVSGKSDQISQEDFARRMSEYGIPELTTFTADELAATERSFRKIQDTIKKAATTELEGEQRRGTREREGGMGIDLSRWQQSSLADRYNDRESSQQRDLP